MPEGLVAGNDSSTAGSAVSEEPQLMNTALLKTSIYPVNRKGKSEGIEKVLRDVFMGSFKF
jgi:hypothetical protein|tara:strand:- start:1006 stop:1188 length:183 start_codon:yes stop_codon:yes gene_type:complete